MRIFYMCKNISPYISVILIAYNRQKFIPYAFKSLTNQNLDYDNFEVILLTNFDINMPELEEFQKRGGNLKRLKIEGTIGLYFEKALSISDGKVLCFLDDDDAFLPNKLQKILDIFKNNEKIGYYSNYMDIINEDGHVYKERNKIGTISSRRREKEMIINNNSSFKSIQKFVAYGGNSFNSTISIRKSILEQYKSILNYTLRTEDEILFAIALDSGYNLMLNSLILTHYRISTSSSSRILQKSNNALNNRCSVIKRELDTFSMVMNTENLLKKQITKQYLRNSYSFDLLIYSAICSHYNKNYNKKTMNLNKDLLYPFKITNIFLISLYFISIIYKKFAIQLYIVFRGD